MALSALASSPAIKVLAGETSFELTRGDVNRHPDSLLHSLLYSVETGDERAPLTLDLQSALSSSRLSTFTHATAFTTALYRHECLPVDLLSTAAKSYITMDLFDKLQQLLDFLNIPGPVSKYLPAKDSIPLRHIGVLDLHVEAAARRAVNLILDSSIHTNGASFLWVRLGQGVHGQKVRSHYEVIVYALSGGRLSKWPKGSSAEFDADCNVQAVRLPAGTSSAGGSVPVYYVGEMLQAAKYGIDVKVEKALSERINTILHRTIEQVPVNGKTGALKTQIIKVTCSLRSGQSADVHVFWW